MSKQINMQNCGCFIKPKTFSCSEDWKNTAVAMKLTEAECKMLERDKKVTIVRGGKEIEVRLTS